MKNDVKVKEKEKSNKITNYREQGITLVALVITVIILLILVGVTLNTALSENGLFQRAKASAEKYNLESEREALSISVTSYQIGKNLDEKNEEDKIGETLNKKNLQHTSDWHIVEVGDTTYDEGWNYVEKGTEIEGYGKARNSWLVNYETGEIIQLEEDKYTSWSAGDMLAVKDSLIINVDSSIIDSNVGNNEKELEARLGEGVDLVNFNYDNNSGLTSTSFNLDGVDDYITVEYDNEEQKGLLANRGFTFEFYGIMDSGTQYRFFDEEGWKKIEYGVNGLFCDWTGDERVPSRLRFCVTDTGGLFWAANDGAWNCYSYSDYCQNDMPWNIWYNISENGFQRNQVCYMTITLDTSESKKINNEKGKYNNGNEFDKEGEFYKARCYINGHKVYDGDYNKKQWDKYKNNGINDLKYLCIGTTLTGDNWDGWNFSKMNCYALRLYSRALTEEEVEANYSKATKYHALLESE